MLQIRLPVDDVSDAEEGQIDRNAAEDIAHRKLGPSVDRRAEGRGEVGKRGRAGEQEGADHRLAETGFVGKLIGGPGGKCPGHGDDDRGD